MADGKFIMFEGIDGSGTTTQSARAAEWLRRQGLSVVETFEPTDGLIGKVIRAVVVLKDGALRFGDTHRSVGICDDE